MAQDSMNDDENRRVSLALREEMARQRLSRQGVADKARISLSSLEKALSGARPFSQALIVRLEEALSISLRHAKPNAPPLAPLALGGYSRDAVRFLEGCFLTLRPSFEMPGAIFAYRIAITWDKALGHLTFCEDARLDPHYTQKGDVSVSFPAGHIFLVTNNNGEMRLAVLSRPLYNGAFYGLLTTLRADRGPQLQPVSVPLALVPFEDGMTLGQITKDDPGFNAYASHLNRVHEGNFARFG